MGPDGHDAAAWARVKQCISVSNECPNPKTLQADVSPPCLADVWPGAHDKS